MNFITLTAVEMLEVFQNILLKNGFEKNKALQLAEVFTANTIDGVTTHGINRFPRFIEYIKKGWIKADAEITLKNNSGSLEQWDGNLGAGPLNAIAATERCMQMAKENSIGCVGLSNTNHWLRGGYYAWQAAAKGFAFIGWTNTIANMPAWNAKDNRLGNNPLVMALPHAGEAIVLDMAMSQFSYGSMELSLMKNEKLSVPGGFNNRGELTNDPQEIIQSKRPLPAGYWKGAGLSLLLDLLAAVLSGGSSTKEISSREAEFGISQVFICFDLNKSGDHAAIEKLICSVIEDYHQSQISDPNKKILYPGERVLQQRKKHLSEGVPVLQTVWQQIKNMNS